MVKWIMVMKIQPSICLVDGGKPRKNSSQVGRHRDSNPDLPNASLVRYHGATSLGEMILFLVLRTLNGVVFYHGSACPG